MTEITQERLRYSIVDENQERDSICFYDTDNNVRLYLMTEVKERLTYDFWKCDKIARMLMLQLYLDANKNEYFTIV